MTTETTRPATDLATRREAPLVPVTLDHEPSVGEMLYLAIQQGTPTEQLERLAALHERMSDRKAAEEFSDSKAKFQAECPPIPKRSVASIVTHSGTSYKYNYAELDAIANVIRPLLHKYGLSYSWDMRETEGGKTWCVCIVSHRNGHKQEARFPWAPEASAKMSETQKHAAALTFAKRQSLIAALGLTCCDPDTDASMNAPPSSCITENQAANIAALADEVNADRAKFLKYFGIVRLAELPADRFAEAIKMLEAKRKATK